MGAGCVRIRVVSGVVCCQVALSKAHLVDPSCDVLSKPHKGLRAGRGGVGVDRGGRSSPGGLGRWPSRPGGATLPAT